jgi:hypothetical protein
MEPLDTRVPMDLVQLIEDAFEVFDWKDLTPSKRGVHVHELAAILTEPWPCVALCNSVELCTDLSLRGVA